MREKSGGRERKRKRRGGGSLERKGRGGREVGKGKGVEAYVTDWDVEGYDNYCFWKFLFVKFMTLII